MKGLKKELPEDLIRSLENFAESINIKQDVSAMLEMLEGYATTFPCGDIDSRTSLVNMITGLLFDLSEWYQTRQCEKI